MSYGYIVDGLRHLGRTPSAQVCASWPNGIYMLNTNSGKIRVRDTGGNKPALLMVPDGPSVIEHFDCLISKLTSHFRVVCFDMPGFGFSYPALHYNFGIEKSCDVIISVMDALTIKQATLSFSCINGHIATSVAKKFPERVTRLVLAQTPSLEIMTTQWVSCNVPKIVKIPIVGQAVNALMSKKFSSKWYSVALPKNSSHKENFIERSSVALSSGGCFCFASIVQGMVNEKSYALSNLEIPTTMIWGNKDWSHKDTEFDSFFENVPHCEIIEFEGCGHFPNLENPKRFAEILCDF